MTERKVCCFLFFDYLDYDVYLNARVFYRLAGYTIISEDNMHLCNLVVVFRGVPPRIYEEYNGTIHFYDYVREHDVDIAKFFPRALSIITISIATPSRQISATRFIYAYLPVIPSLWQFSLPFSRRSNAPIHISNYKPLKDDPYQEQLVSLIKGGLIHVFGGKWDRVNISARPLSYLSANLKLASYSLCYGLMYPYQRGESLSGRMWQAPIQGCIVLTEKCTNPYGCPGVIEISSYADHYSTSNISSAKIADNAATFWIEKTSQLANDLDLTLNWSQMKKEVAFARLLLLYQHFEFLWKQIVTPKTLIVKHKAKVFTRRLSKLF